MTESYKHIRQKRHALLLFLLIVVICCIYGNILHATIFSFSDPAANMTHGWLIPIFSIHALWRQKSSLRVSKKEYSFIGVIGILSALVLLWLGYRHSLLWLKQLSFVSMLWSLVYSLYGKEIAKLTMFPIWYLVFTISIPSVMEDLIQNLQTISTTASFHLMRGFGFEVFQQGHNLVSLVEGSEFQFDIAGPCSGIRSLLALTAFTALYAWHTQKTVTRKWILFISSVPIAVVSNVIRVFSICLVAAMFGEDVAIGYYHDYSGYVVVLMAVLMIFRIGGVLG